MKKFSTSMIVGLTVALVAVPILCSRLKGEVARWHIAAAANASMLGKGTAEEHLEKAKSAFEGADELRDFWLFEIKRGVAENPASVLGILEKAVAQDEANLSLVPYAARALWDRGEYNEQIKVWELARQSGRNLPPEVLNRIAYSRSLIIQDLDQALLDIDKALTSYPNEPAFRDTRAWVLFNMGRLNEALQDSDYSVKAVEKAEKDDIVSRSLETLFGWMTPKPSSEDTGKVLTRAEAGEMLWASGALRFHRAKILDGLGRTDEAKVDWDWLDEHNLPKNDRLF